jgi:hypothetical protein
MFPPIQSPAPVNSSIDAEVATKKIDANISAKLARKKAARMVVDTHDTVGKPINQTVAAVDGQVLDRAKGLKQAERLLDVNPSRKPEPTAQIPLVVQKRKKTDRRKPEINGAL